MNFSIHFKKGAGLKAWGMELSDFGFRIAGLLATCCRVSSVLCPPKSDFGPPPSTFYNK